MTISFHHAFREGDKVVNTVVDALAKLGFKNLTLASSSLLNCHHPLVAHIKSGVISKIYTSGLCGKLAEAVAQLESQVGRIGSGRAAACSGVLLRCRLGHEFDLPVETSSYRASYCAADGETRTG